MKYLKQITLSTILLLMTMLTACKKEDPADLVVNPRDYLTSEHYDKLNIEIIYFEGHSPNQTALDNLETFLENRLNKPDGVHFTKKEINGSNNNSYTVSDLEKLEEKERNLYPKDRELAASIIYTDAGYSTDTENSKTLGVAYGRSSMAIFEPTIDDFSGGIGQVSEANLQTAVLIHEFCHVLGLVNNGTPMAQDHEDANNPGHCDNDECLMYYASNSSSMTGFIFQESVPSIDDQCLDDLKANGGK